MQVFGVPIFAFLISSQALIMPISKPDGSLDMTSLLSHISLLEQKIDNKASGKLESQLQTVMHDLTVTQTKLDTALEELKDLSNVKTELAVLQSQIQSGNSPCTCGSSGNAGSQPTQDLSGLKADVIILQSDVTSLSSDVSSLKSNVNWLQTTMNTTDVQSLSSDMSTLKTEVKQVGSLLKQANVTRLSSEVSTVKTELFQLQSLHNRTSTHQGSSAYTRWGRTSCPPDNSMLYKGFAAGSSSSDKGGSASMLCLPEHPLYSNHTNGVHSDNIAQIWGTKYGQGYFDLPLNSVFHRNMPCVVCESHKQTSIMIPARSECFQGWSTEYSGFLMGGDKRYSPADYICVDRNAEAMPEDIHVLNEGAEMFPVVSKCNPLICPPYVDGKAVTCVVCSK